MHRMKSILTSITIARALSAYGEFSTGGHVHVSVGSGQGGGVREGSVGQGTEGGIEVMPPRIKTREVGYRLQTKLMSLLLPV